MDMKASGRAIVATMIAACSLAAGLRAKETSAPGAGPAVAATKVLHFPKDQHVGTLQVEDWTSGGQYRTNRFDPVLPGGLDRMLLALRTDWKLVGVAQNDVAVPADRSIQLLVYLRRPEKDAAKLAALPPRQYKMFGTDRCREDPNDLSGLSGLDPNGLCRLQIYSLVPRANADQGVLEPIARLAGLQMLLLQKTGATDKGLEHLRGLRSLRSLELREDGVGDAGMAVLKELPALEYLDLETATTDAGFKHLGRLPSLRWLRVRTGRIRGPGLAELANLPHLERLCLWGVSEISDQHIRYLEGLSHLKSLTLWGVADSLTDASLASIGKLKDLEELYFVRTSPKFTPTGVIHLRNLKNLREVDFAGTWSSPEGARYGDEVVRLLAPLPHLESLAGTGFLSAEGVRTLTTIRNAHHLDIMMKDYRQGYRGPTGLPDLAALDSLEELDLNGARALSDEDLARLEPLTHLKSLSLMGERMGDRGMTTINKIKSLESLNLLVPVSKRGLNQLGDLTNLRTLSVAVPSGLSGGVDEIPLNLSGLTSVTTLYLRGLPLHDEDLASLADLRHVQRLEIDGGIFTGGAFTEKALLHLKALPELEVLLLTGISCSSSEGLASLGGLKKLRDLNLQGRITDAALVRLPALPSLWSLTVQTDEPIRPETIARLKQTLPMVEFIHIDKPLLVRPPPLIQSSPAQPGHAPTSSPRANPPIRANPRRSP
ncbi:MAG: hypothetical protein NTZ17_01140 [Phycisphaerae bacterium]|nr:hypothetical protein [Phycisphaerae bacterium]